MSARCCSRTSPHFRRSRALLPRANLQLAGACLERSRRVSKKADVGDAYRRLLGECRRAAPPRRDARLGLIQHNRYAAVRDPEGPLSSRCCTACGRNCSRPRPPRLQGSRRDPYGRKWYPYLMRRPGERPANLLFFVRARCTDGSQSRVPFRVPGLRKSSTVITLAVMSAFVLAFEATEVAKAMPRTPFSSMEPTLHCARPGAWCEAVTDRVIINRLPLQQPSAARSSSPLAGGGATAARVARSSSG